LESPFIGKYEREYAHPVSTARENRIRIIPCGSGEKVLRAPLSKRENSQEVIGDQQCGSSRRGLARSRSAHISDLERNHTANRRRTENITSTHIAPSAPTLPTRPGCRHDTEYGLAFSFPLSNITNVLHLLTYVRQHPTYQDYVTAEGGETGAWSPPHLRGDLIEIYGPVLAHGSREPWSPTPSVELEYLTMADLHSNLCTVADIGSRHHRRRASILHAPPTTRQPSTPARHHRPERTQERFHTATTRYEASRRVFTATTNECRRLLDLCAQRRSHAHTAYTAYTA
jgi:hypothetical protein